MDATFGMAQLGAPIAGKSGETRSVGIMDENALREHEQALDRLDRQSASHEMCGRYKEALEALAPPYLGGCAETRSRYARRRRDLKILLEMQEAGQGAV